MAELSMEDIREYGKMLGILSLGKFMRKDDLIRTIQLAEGKEDCFGRNPSCRDNRCVWAHECKMTTH